jgi:hypothetical protein
MHPIHASSHCHAGGVVPANTPINKIRNGWQPAKKQYIPVGAQRAFINIIVEATVTMMGAVAVKTVVPDTITLRWSFWTLIFSI